MTDAQLNKNNVLVLNALWMAIGTLSLRKAIIALNSEMDATRAIDVTYNRQSDGKFNLEEVKCATPYSFDEWLMVDFREGLDQYINTPKLKVRCPTVIITKYAKMPMRRLRLTKSLLYEMQKGICGYSGKKMPMKHMNIEHKKARSHGGDNSFGNVMLVDEEINKKRGNRPLSELGLVPLFNHREPKPIPASCTIRSAVHPDWAYFLPDIKSSC
jgi:hypothetical protein